MKTLICFLSLVLFHSLAFAADITLKDGRTFKNATIISQSPGNVMIQYDYAVTEVPKTLLPPELQTEYPPGRDTRPATVKNKKARLNAAKLNQADDPSSLKCQPGDTEVGLSDEQGPSEETIKRDRLNRAISGSQTMAEKYFRTEYELVTKAKNIGSIKVTLSKPQLIEGWDNRWTVHGKCEVKYDGEVVRVYPVPPKNANGECRDQGLLSNFDPTPYDITQYKTKVQDFEAIYSAETEAPTFDITLR